MTNDLDEQSMSAMEAKLSRLRKTIAILATALIISLAFGALQTFILLDSGRTRSAEQYVRNAIYNETCGKHTQKPSPWREDELELVRRATSQHINQGYTLMEVSPSSGADFVCYALNWCDGATYIILIDVNRSRPLEDRYRIVSVQED